MFNLADFIVQNIPLPKLPSYLVQYERGRTPLSTLPPVISALVVYLLVVFGLRELRRERQPLRLTFLFQLHNILLSVGSGLLLVLMSEEVFPIWWKHGLFHAICSHKAWTPVS
jgi:fatty acid elongase 3